MVKALAPIPPVPGILKSGRVRAIAFLGLFVLIGAIHTLAQSTREFTKDGDTLVAYTDVPGLAPSEFYTIRVRSAATGNEWVECFANITRNRASELPNDPTNDRISNYRYLYFTDKWSHTWGTIEMSKDSPVEVEIAARNNFTIDKKAFYKAAVHPAHKAGPATVVDGKVYFTLAKPAQIVIDINGQMDDFNAAVNPIGAPVHTISLFANPVLAKPSLSDPTVVPVEPGTKPSAILGSNTTLYFKPGVHDVGIGFKLYPGKKYYIPGDAIVYGTLNNFGVSGPGGLQSGENIKVFGYGTLSGARIHHPDFVSGTREEDHKSISIDDGLNMEFTGICVVDPAFHSVHLSAYRGFNNQKEVTFARWVKVISWRTNGDGIGNTQCIEDCFIRTSDDCSYIKGSRRRCTFWKDANAAVFHMAGTPAAGEFIPLVIEDCDIIYNRTRGSIGGVFVQRAEGDIRQYAVDLTVRNIRVHDKNANVPVFNMFSEGYGRGTGSSFKGIIFQNITIAHPTAGGVKQVLSGCARAPWYGGITFDNVTIAGKPLTGLSEFETNQYVKDIVFKQSPVHAVISGKPFRSTLNISQNAARGIVRIDAAGKLVRSIRIYDIQGKELLADTRTVQRSSIDISGLGKGLFVFKIQASDAIYTRKIALR